MKDWHGRQSTTGWITQRPLCEIQARRVKQTTLGASGALLSSDECSLPNFRLAHTPKLHHNTAITKHVVSSRHPQPPPSPSLLPTSRCIHQPKHSKRFKTYFRRFKRPNTPRILDIFNNGRRKGQVLWWQEFGREDLDCRGSQEAAESLYSCWTSGKHHDIHLLGQHLCTYIMHYLCRSKHHAHHLVRPHPRPFLVAACQIAVFDHDTSCWTSARS